MRFWGHFLLYDHELILKSDKFWFILRFYQYKFNYHLIKKSLKESLADSTKIHKKCVQPTLYYLAWYSVLCKVTQWRLAHNSTTVSAGQKVVTAVPLRHSGWVYSQKVRKIVFFQYVRHHISHDILSRKISPAMTFRAIRFCILDEKSNGIK